MLTSIEIPKYLDVLLILDEKITKAKIYKILDRSSTYLTDALKYFQEHKLILLYNAPKDDRQLMIELTPKGKDVQKIIITLYNVMGLNQTRR
jgi:DNA-binding MarR family transcriptional regulator